MTGRLIRILDEHTVLINVGTFDGVSVGDRFGIYTGDDRIIDPDTGDDLGPLRLRKAVVEVSRVQDRFAIATSIVRHRSPWQLPLAGLAGEAVRDPLPVSRVEVKPLPGGMEIHVGDPVELLPTPQKVASQPATAVHPTATPPPLTTGDDEEEAPPTAT